MQSCLLLQIWAFLHHNTQPVLIFSRVSIFNLERLEKVTWFHSFDCTRVSVQALHCTVQSFAFHTTGLVAATSLIGDPINCDKEGQVFEDHCWIHGAIRTGVGDLDDQKLFGCVLKTSDCNKDGGNCKVSSFLPYECYHDPLLITNRSWILTIHREIIF